ncbi:MAG: beta-ketoacyl synthase chain length factor [Bacteroidales bacterium]|jgi:3-oxoacyl-[acyl-carrier-protein] synthase II
MKRTPIYINGIGLISIQKPLSDDVIYNPEDFSSNYVKCQDPDYKQYINAGTARRMSPIIKRSIVTSKTALQNADVSVPDAIISGTGLGCATDTEKFLTSMVENNEEFLSPTAFIHSTHNTLSSQVAIDINCKNYNNTFMQKGVSFEHALLDAVCMIRNNEINNGLVMGNDELNEKFHKLYDNIKFWKTNVESTLNIAKQNDSYGSFAGEGSSALVVTNCFNEKSYAKISDLKITYNTKGIDIDFVENFLSENNLSFDDVDLVLTGTNGDKENDLVYNNLFNNSKLSDKIGLFRNLSGYYYTSSGFGFAAAAICLKNRLIPKHLTLNGKEIKNPENILFYNHSDNKQHALSIISKCTD